MAVVASESLYSVIQNFMSPEVIQKISLEINQPVEKTRTVLKSVIPLMLMGIINKASTKEGAEGLVDMASQQAAPSLVYIDPSTIKKSDEVLNNIFGNNLSNTVSTLGVSTGMNTWSITKMMGISAPLIMGFIGTKIKKDKMNALGLMNFLNQQKSALNAFMPSGFSNVKNLREADFNNSQKSIWPKVVLAVLLIIGGIWMFNSLRTRSLNTTMVVPAAKGSSALLSSAAQSIWTLEKFMNSSIASGSMMRFKFDNLLFKSGIAGIVLGENGEINQIAFIMNTYLNSTARIEGFTDSTGSISLNEELSYKRAMAVKNELVSQGIEPSRLIAVGMGEQNPLATNETALGRAQNRRIEFIITK